MSAGMRFMEFESVLSASRRTYITAASAMSACVYNPSESPLKGRLRTECRRNEVHGIQVGKVGNPQGLHYGVAMLSE